MQNASLWTWLDPLHGVGYQFWSGIGGTIAPALAALILYLAPSRCHELGCRRRAQKAHPSNGFYYCERHIAASIKMTKEHDGA